MPPPLATGLRPPSAPSFYVTARQPVRPVAILLAILIAAAAGSSLVFGLGHSRGRHFPDAGPGAARSPSAKQDSPAPDKEDKDDPSQVDTIVLGDAADAPLPARRGDRISDVHATIIIHLPRFGEQIGLIPDNPAGHLLYGWLAAFNQGSSLALEKALPNSAPNMTVTAQMVLRQQTGGFNLLSAREVRPGVLVFRLRDQTPLASEVLGTLQVRPGSNPAALASFSLRAVPPPLHGTTQTASTAPAKK